MVSYKRLNNKRLKNDKNEKRLLSSRLIVLAIIIIACSVLLITRLTHLQVSQFNKYQTMSNKNQLSIIPLPPPRGLIYDRNGVVLAENMPVYSLEIIPERADALTDTLRKLQQLIPSISNNDLESFDKLKKQYRRFDSIPIKLKLNPEEVALFAVNQYKFPGISIKARLIRNYPLGSIMAHILGFVGRINQSELITLDKKNYRATNFIGKVGIEKYYETTLHGKIGYQRIEVDASGRPINLADKIQAKPGNDLYITIDSKLQISTANAMRAYRGSVVVINPNNGEILAMVSTPSYDSNLFVQGINNEDYKELEHDKNQPLFNRSIRGQYPPASTIKPFIALGALQNKIIDDKYKVYDPGWFKLASAKHIYRDWKRGGHGWVSLNRAITVSCDTYFYQIASLMGIRRIEDILNQFGFGQSTHIDLGEELGGLVPSKQWKMANKHLSWYKGDTLISGIGQGFMLSTPLQLAHATAGIALKGRHFRPHLLLSTYNRLLENSKINPILEEYPVQITDKNNWQLIINAMRNVIKSREGTGFRFGRTSPYTVAAKTGTAQVVSNKWHEYKKYKDIPKSLRDHSSFIGFAPVEKPEIAIAVMVENDYMASNIARKVMNAYFNEGKR